MSEKKTKVGDRVRYFPNIWDENDFHDGTVIDDQGTVRFDDGYEITTRVEEDAALLSLDKLDEIGVSYDEQNNQFTSRKQDSADTIAYALAHNRIQIAYEESSGELVWLQKEDDAELTPGEKMKGYKFIGDPQLPLEVHARMMEILAQVTQHVAEHGLKKENE